MLSANRAAGEANGRDRPALLLEVRLSCDGIHRFASFKRAAAPQGVALAPFFFSTLGITRVSPDHDLKVSTIALTIDWIQIASLAA